MADKKISALTAATTPLAGTEVLPIVQSGATVKVAVSDLTAGRAISATAVGAGVTTTAAGVTVEGRNGASGTALRASNSGGGYAEIACTSNGTSEGKITYTNQMTVSGGNFVLSSANFVVSNGNGISFAATPGTGTSELLADYEEGTWTPTDGSAAALTFTSASGVYTKIGRLVTASCTLTYPTTATANAAYISGLPFNQGSTGTDGGYITNNTSATPLLIRGYSAATVQPVTQAGAAIPNSAVSAATVRFTVSYIV
jgi:hypothetical protein